MADFALAIAGTLAHEGGFSDHTADRGGATKYGITAATLGEARGLGRKATSDEVRALTRAEAVGIYRARYWDALQLDLVRDDRVAAKVFDVAVNAGPRQAVKLLQRAIDHAAPPGVAHVADDGILGPKTLASLAACDPDVVLGAYCSEQASFYLGIIDRDPAQAVFKAAWLARATWKPGKDVA